MREAVQSATRGLLLKTPYLPPEGDGVLGLLAFLDLPDDGYLRVKRETLAFLAHFAWIKC